MPKILLTVFNLLVFVTLFAQGQPSVKLNQGKLFKDSPLKQKTLEFPSSYRPDNLTFIQELSTKPETPMDTAYFSHSNSYGSVYNLPGSNMPMLKPQGILNTMPGTSSNDSLFLPKSGDIPNGLQLKGLVFERPSTTNQ